MRRFVVLFSILALGSGQTYTASKLVKNIYNECLSQYSVACVKPRALEWISTVSNDEEIKLTEDLSIVRIAAMAPDSDDVDPRLSKDPMYEIFDKVDRFLQTHSVRVNVPREIRDTAASEYVPRSLLTDLPSVLTLPLDSDVEDEVVESRKKKIKLPKPLRIKSSE